MCGGSVKACLPIVLLSSMLSFSSSSFSIRMENRLCRVVEGSLAVLFLCGEVVTVVYLKVCLPPFKECIVITGGVVVLHVNVNGPDGFPKPGF